MARSSAWRRALPPLLLIVVASAQVTLTRVVDLSPWKGGGFGMFSTTDGTAFRYVRVFVSAPGRSEELDVPPSIEIAADRAALYPSSGFLTSVAERVAAREARHARPVDDVRVEVWRVDFDRDLHATTRRLQAVVHHVAAEPGDAR